jgi:hypothetical protein
MNTYQDGHLNTILVYCKVYVQDKVYDFILKLILPGYLINEGSVTEHYC